VLGALPEIMRRISDLVERKTRNQAFFNGYSRGIKNRSEGSTPRVGRSDPGSDIQGFWSPSRTTPGRTLKTLDHAALRAF
jgi:hypothetical protein